MKSRNSIVFLSSVLVIFVVASLERNEIDWEAELDRLNDLFAVEYGAGEMDRLVHDLYTEGFVYISPMATVVGDFEEAAKRYETRRKFGNWTEKPLKFVSTCGRSAVAWSTLSFTDGENMTRDGFETLLFQLVDDRLKGCKYVLISQSFDIPTEPDAFDGPGPEM